MLNLNVSVISVSTLEIASVKVKFTGPIAENQSIPIPIELLNLLESSIDES